MKIEGIYCDWLYEFCENNEDENKVTEYIEKLKEKCNNNEYMLYDKYNMCIYWIADNVEMKEVLRDRPDIIKMVEIWLENEENIEEGLFLYKFGTGDYFKIDCFYEIKKDECMEYAKRKIEEDDYNTCKFIKNMFKNNAIDDFDRLLEIELKAMLIDKLKNIFNNIDINGIKWR